MEKKSKVRGVKRIENALEQNMIKNIFFLRARWKSSLDKKIRKKNAEPQQQYK